MPKSYNTKVCCIKCNREISRINFDKHYNSKACKNPKQHKKIDYPDDLKCRFCGKQCKNKNSFRNHERTCPSNPNRKYKNGMTGKKGWNKGLTKENNESIKKGSETLKARYESGELEGSFKGKSHTEETKRKISEKQKEYLNQNPDKVPYKLYHYSKDRSYPEKYWKEILDKHEVKYDEQYQVNRYTLDFAILNLKIDLEIDGDQHYNDPRIVKSDKRRTAFLEEKGWNVIRIKWSYYQSLNREEKEQYVVDIIEKITGV